MIVMNKSTRHKIIINKKIVKKLFIYLFLFLYIYSPQWIRGKTYLFSSYYWGWVSMVLFLPKLSRIFNDIIIPKELYKKYALPIMGAALYYVFRRISSGQEISFVSIRLIQNLYPFVSLLNMTVVVYMLFEIGYSKKEGICVLINLASIQGIICLLMLAIPSLKNLANRLFINSSSFREGSYILGTRIFGITSDYTYAFPIVHGLLCGISVFIGLKYNKKYFLTAILIFFSVVLNGRTGLLIAIITVLLAAVMNFLDRKVGGRMIIFIFLLPIVVFFMINILQQYVPLVFRFIMRLFIDINGKTGTVDYLLNKGLYFPKGIGLLFGEGHTVFRAEATINGYTATDIGFVNDLFMGGFIFVSLRYGATLLVITKKHLSRTRFDYAIVIMSLTMWILATIKGQASVNSMIIAVLQLLAIMRWILPEEKQNDT